MECVVASAAAVVEKCAGRTQRPRASSFARARPSVLNKFCPGLSKPSIRLSLGLGNCTGREDFRLLDNKYTPLITTDHWRLTYPTTRRWVSRALPSPRPPMPPPARAKRPSVASPHPTRCRPRRPRNALKSRSGRAALRSPPPRPEDPPARRVHFSSTGKGWKELDAVLYAPAGTRQRP